MKLKKNFKKVWAYVLVVAMGIASLTGYQAQTVSADITDWSVLSYAGDGAAGGAYNNLYKVYSPDGKASLVNIQNSAVDSEAGLYVTFSGEVTDCSLGAGNYSKQGAGAWLDLTAFTARETEVTVTAVTGTSTFYVYYENGVDTGEFETSVSGGEEPTGDEVTSAGGTDGETTPSDDTDYSYLTFREGTNGATDLAFATLEDFVYYALCDDAGMVNLQTKPGEGTEPIYPDFTNLTLNGAPIPEGYYTAKGASIIIPADRTGLIKDKYNVIEGTSAVGGTKFHIIIKYGNPPVDPNRPTEAPTTTKTPETTTYKSPVDTETESTTRVIEYFNLVQCQAVSTYQNIGGFRYLLTPGVVGYVGVDPTDNDHIQVKSGSGPVSGGRFTIAKNFRNLIPGTSYVITMEITPSEALGTYTVLNDTTPRQFVEGTTILSFTKEAYNAGGYGQIDFTMSLTGMGKDVILDIDNVSIRVANPEDLTTAAPTTAAATTEAQTTTVAATTAAQTTTATSNTETTAATTDAATTVAATTATNVATTAAVTTTATADKAVKAPGKAKVKKVTAKKKASKTVKLTLKTVKGAKGYQVQISKAKKFTKKNILVKKIVKKVKPAIKSKKLKGQKKLFVRARAYVLDANGKKVYGKWSVAKKVKIK